MLKGKKKTKKDNFELKNRLLLSPNNNKKQERLFSKTLLNKVCQMVEMIQKNIGKTTKFELMGIDFQNKIIGVVTFYNIGSSQITGSLLKIAILETNYEKN